MLIDGAVVWFVVTWNALGIPYGTAEQVRGEWPTKEQCRIAAIAAINAMDPIARPKWSCENRVTKVFVPLSAEKLELK